MRITGKGTSDLENKFTGYAATLTGKWAAVKDDEILHCMAHGAGEERQQAFDAFYRRHAEYFYGICYNLVNRFQFGFFGADDVFHATMLKARDQASTFRANGITEAQELEDAVDAWLGGIAKRVVLDLVRRKPNFVCLDPQLIDGDEYDDETVFQITELCAGDETEEKRLMRESIETLSPREQEVIWAMCQFYQRRAHQRTPTDDLDQIISSLGISRENFRKIKQRAKQKIFDYMTNRKPVTEAK